MSDADYYDVSSEQSKQMLSRQKKHKIHYSRLKSAAITACYRLKQMDPKNILLQKTTAAAVDGMRPHLAKQAQELNQSSVTSDIVEDAIYNHNENNRPITGLCIIAQSGRKELRAPDGWEFVQTADINSSAAVSVSNDIKNDNNGKYIPHPILFGSGKKFYLCCKRRSSSSERAITDIQVTFESIVPLAYQPLNYLLDGTLLPYFQEPINDKNDEKNDSNKNEENKIDNKIEIKDTTLSLLSINKKTGKNDVRRADSIMPSLSNYKNRNKIDDDTAPDVSLLPGQEAVEINFNKVPLIIFSTTGDSPIVDIRLKRLGTRMKDGWISVDKTLNAGHVANLNRGSNDVKVHGVYLSYANDLSPYRFSAKDLNRHVNLKLLTPLLISLHLRNTDLALTAIDSLKYLLLSNFIRFKDHSLMISTLERICSAISQSVVTFDNVYHQKLMEMQIIIFQKFIHHLSAVSCWQMLLSSLIPLDRMMSTKLLTKYVRTSLAYVRVLAFGDSTIEDSGAVTNSTRERNLTSFEDFPKDERTAGGDDEYKSSTVDSAAFFGCMTKFVREFVDERIGYAQAEHALKKLFQTKSFSKKSQILVHECCEALFVSDFDQAWKPLSVLIIFLCRKGLSPYKTGGSRLSEKACLSCVLSLEEVVNAAIAKEYYLTRMPNSFKYLLRRCLSRTISYNLCNQHEKYDEIFNTSLRLFEQICFHWHSFFEHEISCIITTIILPQMLERFTPFSRRQKYLHCISRILQDPSLMHLVYNLDVIHGRRSIHSIIDSLLGILIETASILKHDTPTFEIVNESNKSYTNNYNFHHLAIQCLMHLWKMYSQWFQTNVMPQIQKLNGQMITVELGITEEIWQRWVLVQKIESKARDMACDIKDEKSVKHAVQFMFDQQLLSNHGHCISEWLHKYRSEIPDTAMGEYLGGSRPKQQKPLEEDIRQWYIRGCGLNFDFHIEIVMDFFLTKCGFRMPREAQKIERVLDSFAAVYLQERPEMFVHEDDAFVLFNAVLMLNTSLHNPQIKDKDRLSVEQFSVICEGIKGHNLKRVDFERIFAYIAESPYEISFEDEEKSHTIRMFDKWQRKNMMSPRRPYLAMRRELKYALKEHGFSINSSEDYLVPNDMYKTPQNSHFPSEEESKQEIWMKKKQLNKRNMSQSAMLSGPMTPNMNIAIQLGSMGSMGTFKYNANGSLPYLATAGGIFDDDDIDIDIEDDDDEDPESKFESSGSLDNTSVISKSKTLPHTNSHQNKFESNNSLTLDMDIVLDILDDKKIDPKQAAIDKQMIEVFENYGRSKLEIDIIEYGLFCDECLTKSFWNNNQMSMYSTFSETVAIQNTNRNHLELACLLLDNWWSKILDALKIIFELNDDPYTTPLALGILPHIIKISITLGSCGHDLAKIAFISYINEYKYWWLNAIQRIDEATKQSNANMATEEDLNRIETRVWDNPTKHYEKLKKYIQASQHIIHSRTIWLRLRDLQFQFQEIHFMLKGREFIGEQTIMKIGGRNTTYRLFFFNDMLLYANCSNSHKYKVHRVLLLVFCALEDSRFSSKSKNIQHQFRIHSPQKSITIALPTAEYKKICYKKISDLIIKQRRRVRKLIAELDNYQVPLSVKKYQNYGQNENEKQEMLQKHMKTLAVKFQKNCSFLHQTMETILKNYSTGRQKIERNYCKLCLTSFNKMGRRRKKCPLCEDDVCPKCIQRKATLPESKKKKNVCDGCLDMVEGRLKLYM